MPCYDTTKTCVQQFLCLAVESEVFFGWQINPAPAAWGPGQLKKSHNSWLKLCPGLSENSNIPSRHRRSIRAIRDAETVQAATPTAYRSRPESQKSLPSNQVFIRKRKEIEIRWFHDLITVVEYLQALLVLFVFLMLAIGFKLTAWKAAGAQAELEGRASIWAGRIANDLPHPGPGQMLPFMNL